MISIKDIMGAKFGEEKGARVLIDNKDEYHKISANQWLYEPDDPRIEKIIINDSQMYNIVLYSFSAVLKQIDVIKKQ